MLRTWWLLIVKLLVKDNSFLWCSHHVKVTPSSDVVQSRVTRTSAPRLVQVCYMFTSLQGCGGWEKRWKLVNRCLSTAPRCDRPLSPSPPRSLARVCSLPSGGAEGYRSRLKFSMICSVTFSDIVIITSYLVSSIDVLFWVSFVPLVVCKKAL